MLGPAFVSDHQSRMEMEVASTDRLPTGRCIFMLGPAFVSDHQSRMVMEVQQRVL